MGSVFLENPDTPSFIFSIMMVRNASCLSFLSLLRAEAGNKQVRPHQMLSFEQNASF